jgi:hypothetical protein
MLAAKVLSAPVLSEIDGVSVMLNAKDGPG